MTITTRIFSALAAATVTASGVAAMALPASSPRSGAVPAAIVDADAQGRPILLARMVVTATPLTR